MAQPSPWLNPGLPSCPDSVDWMTFPSTTILLTAAAVEAGVFAGIVFFAYDGVRTVVTVDHGDGSENGQDGGDNGGGAAHLSLTDAAAAINVKTKRDRRGLTNNNLWVIYFVCLFFQFALTALVLHPRHFSANIEVVRVTFLGSRVFLGLSCVSLTAALNHQRTYKMRDYAGGSVNVALQQQSTKVVIGSTIVYLLFLAAEFVAAHVVNEQRVNVTNSVWFWCYFVCLILLAIPAMFATLWVCVHESEVQPTAMAKRILLVGIAFHFLTMFPSSFWEEHVLPPGFVDDHPCLLVIGNVFDLTLALFMIGEAFIFTFVRMEYRRNRLIHLNENLARTSHSLASEADFSHVDENYGLLQAQQSAANNEAVQRSILQQQPRLL